MLEGPIKHIQYYHQLSLYHPNHGHPECSPSPTFFYEQLMTGCASIRIPSSNTILKLHYLCLLLSLIEGALKNFASWPLHITLLTHIIQTASPAQLLATAEKSMMLKGPADFTERSMLNSTHSMVELLYQLTNR